MPINLLDQNTINKIAAGEVVERPSSVVKELAENAIDAGASAVTVEIKDGGISFIRITDNGCGIEASEVRMAFKRHSTSKIRDAADLACISSLGFRGEALSSISAVARVELITKTAGEFSGVRYCIEGGEEKSMEEVGAPEGTTFIVRNLFYNTPARRKFLKTPATEGGYISSVVEQLCLSHPEISFRLIVNNQPKIQTAGNGKLKDVIYTVFGRDIAANLIEIDRGFEKFSVRGFIGKPAVCRGNRNYENYYINGRYIRSGIVSKAIEEAYAPFIMQHKYPFTALHIEIEPELLDVNVHPSKMELRFSNGPYLFDSLKSAVSGGLSHRELIPEITAGGGAGNAARGASAMREASVSRGASASRGESASLEASVSLGASASRGASASLGASASRGASASLEAGQERKAEPQQLNSDTKQGTFAFTREPEPVKPAGMPEPVKPAAAGKREAGQAGKAAEAGREKAAEAGRRKAAEARGEKAAELPVRMPEPFETRRAARYDEAVKKQEREGMGQLELFERPELLKEQNKKDIRIVGQVFDTYWIMEFEKNMYIVDQHAAHEKVLFEKFMRRYGERRIATQYISPPVVFSVTMQEENVLLENMEYFKDFGFELESFGGDEYSVSGIPADFAEADPKGLLLEILDSLVQDSKKGTPESVKDRIAAMSCKAAVKGGGRLSFAEAQALLGQLMELDNPYNCPHGRPTMITMSKYELEKKFKRIV